MRKSFFSDLLRKVARFDRTFLLTIGLTFSQVMMAGGVVNAAPPVTFDATEHRTHSFHQPSPMVDLDLAGPGDDDDKDKKKKTPT